MSDRHVFAGMEMHSQSYEDTLSVPDDQPTTSNVVGRDLGDFESNVDWCRTKRFSAISRLYDCVVSLVSNYSKLK